MILSGIRFNSLGHLEPPNYLGQLQIRRKEPSALVSCKLLVKMSASVITHGLKLLGGSMLGGIVVIAAGAVIVTLGCIGIYRWARRRFCHEKLVWVPA